MFRLTETMIVAALAAAGVAFVVFVAIPSPLTETAGVAAIAIAIRLAMPRGNKIKPWQIYLPTLIIYNVAGLMVEQPSTTAQQAQLLAMYCACFLVGGILGHLAPLTPPKAARQVQVAVSAGSLMLLELLGLLLVGYVFKRYGVPILSADAATTRVLLTSGHATQLVLGEAALQLVLVLDLLRFSGFVQVVGKRGRWMHIVLALGILFATTARSQVLVPIAFAAIVMILNGWRRRGRVLGLGAAAFGVFLFVGALRQAAAGGQWYAPARAYLVGTVQVEDTALRHFGNHRPFFHGDLMLWFVHRFSDPLTTPPGITIRDAYGRTLNGFGLEPGAIAGFYLDWGIVGVVIGGLAFGAVAMAFYRRWQVRGGWSTLSYGYVLLWMILSITQHPVASYWYIEMPILLGLFARANRKSGTARETKSTPATMTARTRVAVP